MKIVFIGILGFLSSFAGADVRPPVTYYQVLGLNRTASQLEIQTARSRLLTRNTADFNSSQETKAWNLAISEAWFVLHDPDHRAIYDFQSPPLPQFSTPTPTPPLSPSGIAEPYEPQHLLESLTQIFAKTGPLTPDELIEAQNTLVKRLGNPELMGHEGQRQLFYRDIQTIIDLAQSSAGYKIANGVTAVGMQLLLMFGSGFGEQIFDSLYVQLSEQIRLTTPGNAFDRPLEWLEIADIIEKKTGRQRMQVEQLNLCVAALLN